jgi:hypothetical protein
LIRSEKIPSLFSWANLKVWQDYDGEGRINGKWEVRNGK